MSAGLLTPEMRRQILKLKDELDDHDILLYGQLDILNNIHDALEIARCSADCLLTSDPFKAWEELHPFRGASTAEKQDRKKTVKNTAGVEKLITRQMRQQIVEAKKRLENYASCLDEFFDDVVELTSLDTAKQLAEDLLCYEPLKTAAARKKRENAAAEEDLDLP